MPDGTDMHIGARIAEQRKLAHMTGRGLAQKANISYSLLAKIESGHRPASPAVVAACSRALGVEVSTLVGQPYAESRKEERFDAPLSAIRASLENWDLPLVLEETSHRPLHVINRDVQDLVRDRRRADYKRVAIRVPALIDELVAAVHNHEGKQRERCHRMLTLAYRGAHEVAYRLGQLDLSNTILGRMSSSADQSGDPYLGMLVDYLRAQSCFNTGRHDVGLALMERSLSEAEEAARRGEHVARCVQGNLRLRAAILNSREEPGSKGRADAARSHWAEAHDLARALGQDTQTYVFSFGPSNTAIHQVAMEVELGEYGRAVKQAKQVHFPTEFVSDHPDRVSHHYIDLARAQLWTGEREQAFASLQEARRVAPLHTRFHPHAKETAATLVRARRRATEPVEAFARWVGV